MGTRPGTSSLTAGPPENYRIASTLDLKKDRAAALTVQILFAFVIGLMVVLAVRLDLPVDSPWPGGVVALVTVAACLVYMVVHELTHGVLLRWLTGVRPTYAVRLPYLVTGSQALLTRRVAIVVALAPLVLWSLVLLSLLRDLPAELFLTVYVVLALNVAASAGDVVEAWVIGRLPRAALIRDDGEQTTVYVPAS